VVVAPRIPGGGTVGGFAGEAGIFGEWAEIAVGVLEGDEFVDEFLKVGAEARVVGEAEDLSSGREIFAGEFARPGEEVAIGLFVAVAEHVEHGRIVDGGAEEPVVGDGGDVIVDVAVEIDAEIWREVEGGRKFVGGETRKDEEEDGEEALHRAKGKGGFAICNWD